MKNDTYFIEKCRDLIEAKLSWGNSSEWQNQDFENLSTELLEKTNVSLSSSTLKRIWGKVNYNSAPSTATLNALAQFIEYENWRAFTSSYDQPLFVEQSLPKTNFFKSIKPSYWWISSGLFLVLFFALSAFYKNDKTLTFDKVVFTSQPVAFGVPNTVIFNYDASNSNADSVFIQQSWDVKRRYKVEKNLHEYTSTYYTPGYFRAKLILNDSIVKEHDLLIESDGWLGTIDASPQPIYLSKIEIKKSEMLSITAHELLKHKVDVDTGPSWTSFFNVSKQKRFSTNNFRMEATIRNTFDGKGGACKQMKIILFSTKGIVVIPLSVKGCVGELEMRIGDDIISGKTTNLVAFGVNGEDWTAVRFEMEDQIIQIFINDMITYKSNVKYDLGQIVGTRISFLGSGDVKNFKMNEVILQ